MYEPAVATPVAVHVILAPTARTVAGHVTVTPLSSTTPTAESSTFPVLVTKYVQFTVDPTNTDGPSEPFVSLDIVKPKVISDAEILLTLFRSTVFSPELITSGGFTGVVPAVNLRKASSNFA